MKAQKARNKQKGARPEHSAPAEHFYDHHEATQYADNARMTQIQTNLSRRALHLLNLPPGRPSLLLDVGCGTGFGGRVLEKSGHAWIGTDISVDMLAAGKQPGLHSDHLAHDMGCLSPFRKGMFDGAISISAVQWLCVAQKEEHVPQVRLRTFLAGLRNCLRPGARAVLQFYPEDPSQMEMVRTLSLERQFSGSLVTDYPLSEAAKKFFLVLTAPKQGLPAKGGAKGSEKGGGKRSDKGGGKRAGEDFDSRSGKRPEGPAKNSSSRKVNGVIQRR